MKITILILAAGSSTRMKTTKQLLPVGKNTLLGVVIKNVIKSNANKIYCVLGANAEIISESISKYNIESIFNPKFKSGLSSSIITGVQHIKNQNVDAVLILLGDQPLITTKYINEMIDTYQYHSEKIIASSYNDTIGVPTIIPKAYYNQLLNLKGDKGAKEFLNKMKGNIIQLENTNLMDIDTKKDYQDYLNSLSFE